MPATGFEQPKRIKLKQEPFRASGLFFSLVKKPSSSLYLAVID